MSTLTLSFGVCVCVAFFLDLFTNVLERRISCYKTNDVAIQHTKLHLNRDCTPIGGVGEMREKHNRFVYPLSYVCDHFMCNPVFTFQPSNVENRLLTGGKSGSLKLKIVQVHSHFAVKHTTMMTTHGKSGMKMGKW